MSSNSSSAREQIIKETILNFANVNGYNLENKIVEEESRLTKLYNNSNMTEKEFYESEMIKYGKIISDHILEDYGHMLDDETKSKIANFSFSNQSIIFQDDEHFKEINITGKNVSAYAREDGKVCFPLYDGKSDIVTFIRKREQELIHEIFHIVTKNHLDRQDLIYAGVKIGKYTPGKLFNEAMAEKCARDFATKHNLIYHPMYSYIPYAKSLELFMNKYGIQNNSQLFNRNYQEIISIATPQEQKQYYDFENNYYLMRLGKNNTNNENYEPAQNINNPGQQNQSINPKKRVRTLNTNITSNNNGFINILVISAISIVLLVTIILIYNFIK